MLVRIKSKKAFLTGRTFVDMKKTMVVCGFLAVAGLPLSDARSVGCGRCGDPKSRNRSLRSARRSSERSEKKCCCDEPQKSQNLELNSSSENNDEDTKDVDDKTSEEIRKIVEGLRGVRIGDSRLVGPAERVTNLEKQIKRAVVEMQNAPREMTETNVEAQGDARNFSQTVTDSEIEVRRSNKSYTTRRAGLSIFEFLKTDDTRSGATFARKNSETRGGSLGKAKNRESDSTLSPNEPENRTGSVEAPLHMFPPSDDQRTRGRRGESSKPPGWLCDYDCTGCYERRCDKRSQSRANSGVGGVRGKIHPYYRRFEGG